MDSFLPKTHWAYSQPEYQYPFDPALGQSLLEEAGWNLLPEKSYRSNEQGEELSFEFTTTVAELRQTWAAVFEIQLQACGIRLIRRNVTGDWWFGDTTGLKQRDFEIGAFAWVSEWDLPVNSYYGCDSVPSVQNGFQGDNFMGWCNRTASDAADQASNALLSQTERKTAFVILQNEFAKDLPSIPLFLRDDGATWEHIDFNIRPYFP
jgi:ABC-type transport system substrate-binding protein